MNETMAFQASMKRGGPSNRRSQKEEKSATQCGECGRDGHTRDGCFKIIGYPEWWNVKNKQEKARPKAACAEAEPNKIANLTKEQYEQFWKLFAAEDKPVQSEPPRTANMAGKFKHNDEWIMDSGCTEHITYRSDALENRTQSKNEPPVTIPNGENVPVEGRGIHTLPNGATVQDVLHVPKFTFNLLSGLRTRKLIGAGRCKDGLYQMGMLGTRRRAMIVTSDLWHKRLGHASDDKLSQINSLSDFSFKTSNNVCDSCMKSKFTKLPFPTSTTKTKACFDLIHCDIWGKYRIPSSTKANYFMTIVDDYSRLPSKIIENKTPYELLHSEKPSYDHMRVLGCLAYYRSIETNGDKFEIRGRPSVFMGYPSGTKGYKIYDPSNGKIITSRDVRFVEKVFPFATKFEQDRHEMEDVFATFMDEENGTVEPNMTVAESLGPNSPEAYQNEEELEELDQFSPNNSNTDLILDGLDIDTQSQTTNEPPVSFLTAITKNDEPKSFKQAVQDQHWRDAMQKEIKALEDNGTWTIEELPNGKRVIDSKWVYKTKFKPNGEVESVHQLDVNNVFLHGDLHEEVYMRIPQGYEKGGGTKVCRLRKSLYGLKQASRNWYQKFTSALLQLNYKQSAADHSLFIYNKGKVFVTALIYVDDVIMVGNDEDQIKETKKFLNEKFSIKDLGPLKYFLGIEAARTKDGTVLSQ
ncbi:putative RNA-directed DNA polymerase [Tanacetum coccineum]